MPKRAQMRCSFFPRTRRYFGTNAVYVGWDSNNDKLTAVSQNPDEEELLLGRQVRYQVRTVENIQGRMIVNAEVIGQDV